MARPGVMEKRQAMIIAGHKLTIIATGLYDIEWSLCVENVHGARTEWCDFFESADEAFAEGRRALAAEPVEAFLSTENLMYLPETDSIPESLKP